MVKESVFRQVGRAVKMLKPAHKQWTGALCKGNMTEDLSFSDEG